MKTNPIPGPLHIPWIGWRLQGLAMLKDPMEYFMNVYRRYGSISSWDPKTRKHICAFGPELHREIMINPDTFIVDAFREGNLPKNSSIERLSFGLVRLNGDKHRLHRKLMQPAFRQDVINSYYNDIVNLTEAELITWKVGELRRLDFDLMRLITFISMKTMFGLDPEVNGKKLQLLIKNLLKYASSPASLIFHFNIPGTPYNKMLKISEQIDHLIREIIKLKVDSGNQGNDVLSNLIRSRDEENIGLTTDELISEAYTVLCHESSAANLSWCLFLLDQHPIILKNLVDELDSTLAGNPPTIEQLEKLPMLDNVIKESIRLFPPAGFSLRYTNKECELGKFSLPKNAMIFLSSYVSHRIPDIFSNPLKFDPQRWDKITPSPHEFVAFGTGAHSCIGRYFALFEIKIILSMLLQRFRVSLLPNSKIDRGIRISLVPKQGLLMQILPSKTTISKPIVKGNIHESIDLQ